MCLKTLAAVCLGLRRRPTCAVPPPSPLFSGSNSGESYGKLALGRSWKGTEYFLSSLWLPYPSLSIFLHPQCSSGVYRVRREQRESRQDDAIILRLSGFPFKLPLCWDHSPTVREPCHVTRGTEYWDQETWALVLALSLVLTFHICKVMALNLVIVKFCASPSSSESGGELRGNCMAWLALGPDWPIAFLS